MTHSKKCGNTSALFHIPCGQTYARKNTPHGQIAKLEVSNENKTQGLVKRITRNTQRTHTYIHHARTGVGYLPREARDDD